jgi:hypothetical protein
MLYLKRGCHLRDALPQALLRTCKGRGFPLAFGLVRLTDCLRLLKVFPEEFKLLRPEIFTLTPELPLRAAFALLGGHAVGSGLCLLLKL